MPKSGPLLSSPPLFCVCGGAKLKGNWPSNATRALPMGSRPFALSLREGLRADRAARRDLLGARPPNIGRQHIALSRLIDRLDRVLHEEAVTPGDQVIQILHHDGVLVRQDPGTRHPVRLERMILDGVVTTAHE